MYDPEDDGEPWVPDEDYASDDDPIDDGYAPDGDSDEDNQDADEY